MLAFMRHGQTQWNYEQRLQGQVDIALNETGRQQAREAAQALAAAGEGWDLVVTSPLGRARETGAIVAETLGIELGGTCPELIERAFGDKEGHCVADATPAQYETLLETAEPVEEVAARGQAALRQIVEEHPGRAVLVVAHGTLIRLTMGALRGKECPRVANCEVVPIEESLLG